MKRLLFSAIKSLMVIILLLSCDDRKGIDVGLAPDVRFILSDSIIKVGDEVQFTDSTLNSPTSWAWEFGDGKFSTDANTSYTYNNSGKFKIKLTATNGYGVDSMVKFIQVGLPPVAYFKASNTNVLIGGTITFTDTSFNAPTSWIWYFGDGKYSSVQNPQNIFTNTGSYDVVLTVSNIFGSDTLTKNNYITVSEIHIFPIDTIQIIPL